MKAYNYCNSYLILLIVVCVSNSTILQPDSSTSRLHLLIQCVETYHNGQLESSSILKILYQPEDPNACFWYRQTRKLSPGNVEYFVKHLRHRVQEEEWYFHSRKTLDKLNTKLDSLKKSKTTKLSLLYNFNNVTKSRNETMNLRKHNFQGKNTSTQIVTDVESTSNPKLTSRKKATKISKTESLVHNTTSFTPGRSGTEDMCDTDLDNGIQIFRKKKYLYVLPFSSKNFDKHLYVRVYEDTTLYKLKVKMKRFIWAFKADTPNCRIFWSSSAGLIVSSLTGTMVKRLIRATSFTIINVVVAPLNREIYFYTKKGEKIISFSITTSKMLSIYKSKSLDPEGLVVSPDNKFLFWHTALHEYIVKFELATLKRTTFHKIGTFISCIDINFSLELIVSCANLDDKADVYLHFVKTGKNKHIHQTQGACFCPVILGNVIFNTGKGEKTISMFGPKGRQCKHGIKIPSSSVTQLAVG